MQDRVDPERLCPVDSTLPGAFPAALVRAGSAESETMNPHGRSLVLTGSALVWVLSQPAAARNAELEELIYKTQLAINAENWESALGYCDKAIQRFGKDRPLQVFGPQFGAIHYRKGLCEMKLARWDAAMRSFEICYRDFPNKNGADDGNPFEKTALLKWAEAAMGAKRWELAISQFRKFLKERDKTRDTFSHGAFYVGLAICHYQLGRIPEGNENLEIALRNKERFGTPDSPIASGFQALVSAAIAKRDEQALLDFIGKNRVDLALDPEGLLASTPLMMKLAGDTIAAGMQRAALAIYQLVPPVEVSLSDARARLKEPDIGPAERKKLEAAIKSLDESLKGDRSPEVARLTAIALLSEKTGNLREAYEALAKLEQLPGNPGAREEILLHLVRLSARTATAADTRCHAEAFIRTFPESSHEAEVQRVLLEALFQASEHDACIETGRAMLGSLKPATPEHDEVLFVLAASLHYRGRFDEAGPLLDEHVKLYPQSGRALQAAYLQACNETRRRNWDHAASLLELFLKRHPDASSNPYLPYALCDLATCQSARQDPIAAFGTLTRATEEFPDSGIIEVAWLMRGDVERQLGQPTAAEKSYFNALKVSEKRKNRDFVSRSLAALVVLFSEEDKSHQQADRTVAFADGYWKDPAEGTPDKARVAMAAAIAYVQVGRGEEGLNRLREAILETARKPDAVELEALIRTYTSAYLLNHRPTELLAHYDTYLGLAPEQTSARALLRMAAIRVFEDHTKRPFTPDEQKAAQATVETLFHQLKTVFPPKVVEDFIRIRIGDLLRCHTNSPGDALPYYEAVIARPDSPRRFSALMGRADVFARSGDPQMITKGIEDYERVIRESGDAGEREFAFYQNIVLWTTRKDYRKAAELAGLYLDQKRSGFSRFIPQVRLCLARCLDELGMVDEAVQAYASITRDLTDDIGVSAPAMLGWLRLVWERNHARDRDSARKAGRDYLNHTRDLKDRMAADDRELWEEAEKVVNSLGDAPGPE